MFVKSLLEYQHYITRLFNIKERSSSIRQELIAGLTTFLAMVYSIVVVPDMLSSAGFDRGSVFIATCLISAFGSLLMGFWAQLPMAIGCAISLTAFTAFNLVLARNIPIPVVLGAIFLMGLVFTLITQSGLRQWILNHLPNGIAQGTGIGIGLFLLLIAACSVGLVVKNPQQGLPIQLGHFTTFPVLMTLFGLAAIIGLMRRQVPGSMLLVIVLISLLGLLFDPKVIFQGLFALPSISDVDGHSLLGKLDIKGAFSPLMLPTVFALVLTAIFDATGTIRAVAEQAHLLDQEEQIINGDKALIADSVSSLFAGIIGGSPAAVYIESAAGAAAGGKTGLSAVVVGVLFVLMLFLSPLSYLVPSYATAPVLMYVGLLMLGNVSKLNFSDPIDALSGLLCAVFIVLSCNVVTGIMLGFCTLVIGRFFSGESDQLNLGTVFIALILFIFYAGGWAI